MIGIEIGPVQIREQRRLSTISCTQLLLLTMRMNFFNELWLKLRLTLFHTVFKQKLR